MCASCANSLRQRGLRVDMHCDEKRRHLLRHVESMAYHSPNAWACKALSPART